MRTPAIRNRIPSDFLLQVAALLSAIILVHAIYTGVIRPQAAAVAERQQERMAEDPDYTPERSIWIVLEGYEQEICFILLLWALALLGMKARLMMRERRLLARDLLPLSPGESILPGDTRAYARSIEQLPPGERDGVYPRALITALHRFRATRSIQDVSEAVGAICDNEMDRLDSELSMIRYIAWAIPSIGFIGTVRGIGEALGLAHQAVEGDISGVTASLGLAFNSTLVALVLSIVVMFLLHQLQLHQERLVQEVHTECDRRVIQNLQVD